MRQVRRKDRQVSDFDEIFSFVESCQIARVAMNTDSCPYIVPLSYGLENADGQIVFYFHSAPDGEKIDLLQKDNRVCVETDNSKGYVVLPDGVSVNYQSFIGRGKAYFCTEDEKIKGLKLLHSHCGFSSLSIESCKMLSHTAVFKVVIEEYTCKKRT